MKNRVVILIALTATLAMLAGSAGAASAPTTFYYGDITLPSGGGSHWQPGTWDLNACPVTVSYTLDLSGAPNVAYTGNYGQSGYVGLVWPGSPWAGAWMSGFLCDWQNSGIEFPTYPDFDNSQDLDDKFNMQRSPYSPPWDETLYDVYCDTNTVAAPPFGSGSNYGIWFDRDGVDPWQANMWGMVNGGTYNTSGVYDVQITYDWSANYPTSKGTACATFFPTLQNDDAPGGYGIPTGFNRIPKTDPNYPGYYDFPAGISFDTDESKMASMRVLVSGNSGDGTIVVRDLTVTGCLALEEGMATGGGWFIPEPDKSEGLINPGGKATFGFVAKQDDKKGSSGHLEFQYHSDNLNLKSTSYDWVTLSNTQVIFEGEGTLNDEPGYKFRVWAFDGDKAGGQPDRFTIRIWTGVGGSFENPTYRAEGDLGGGQIVVHKK
jgi:hypothetical protein